MTSLRELRRRLREKADPGKAAVLARFFKTGTGEYGEGDRFLGLTVPVQRRIARSFRSLPIPAIGRLLESGLHEERLTGLLILIDQYRKASGSDRQKIVDFYLRSRRCVNNWDLVDVSAPAILGDHFMGKDRKPLYDLARSGNLWERRMAVMATFAFVRRNDFQDTFRIAELLLHDSHGLIQKAVGWMLRETGKRDMAAEEEFLLRHAADMPRTMLRYAVERFPDVKRRAYLDIRAARRYGMSASG